MKLRIHSIHINYDHDPSVFEYVLFISIVNYHKKYGRKGNIIMKTLLENTYVLLHLQKPTEGRQADGQMPPRR